MMLTRTTILAISALLIAILAGTTKAQSVRNSTQTTQNATIPSASGAYGNSLFNVGDFNLDGYEDYAVSAPLFNAVGRVYIYSGRDRALLMELNGIQVNDGSFGDSVLAVGDVNSDGFPDICVGAPTFDTVLGVGTGRVACFSGADGTELWSLEGDQANGRFGRSLGLLAGAGPSAATSVLVGQPRYDDAGCIDCGRVVYLNPATGAVQGDEKGFVTFDGLGDTMASRRGISGSFAGSTRGRVYILNGPGQPPGLFTPPHPGNNLPPQISIIMAGDGSALGLAVGRPLDDDSGIPNAGTVSFYPQFSLPGAVIAAGSSLAEGVGGQITEMRDIDGDGDEEIAYGSASAILPISYRCRVIDTAGLLLEDQDLLAAGFSDLASIRDTTGDGRGEWLFSSIPLIQSQMFSRGLEFGGVSTLVGGTINFQYTIDMGPANANRIYLQLYGTSGNDPGFIYNPGAPRVPLFIDSTTTAMLDFAGTPAAPDALGFLDPFGRAQTNVYVGAGVAALLSGVEIDTVAVVLDPTPLTVTSTSNPLRITIP